MNASLLKSLQPGGRLAILEFTPPGQESPNIEATTGSTPSILRPSSVS